MDALAVLQAAWAGACLLVPGIGLARALGLGRNALEEVVVGAALGRLALSLLALALAGRPALAWLPLWGVPWLVVAALATRGARWRRPPAAALVGPLAVVAAAALLVACIGGRSGLPDAAGALVFHGHHTTADPLTYTAVAHQLAQRGLPIPHPLVAGLPSLGHASFFGELVGVRFAGALDPLDVAFRVRPLLDVATLGLTALALARALGASSLGAALAALLLLFGGGVSQLAYAVLHFFDWPLRPVEVWAFGTSFLLPINPIAPGLQTALAAILVAVAARGGPRRAGAIAGLLGAAVLGFKLFLWPPLAAGLAFAALRGREPKLRRRFAWAAGVAVAAALPFAAGTLLLGARLAERAVVGIEPCPGCVPRFLVEWSFSEQPLDWGLLAGGVQSLAEPRAWLVGGAAALLVSALLLGVRLLALAPAARGAAAAGPAAAAGQDALLGAALAGLGLACATTTPPHSFNALQFAWAATFPLWVVTGAAFGRLLAARRRGLVAALLVVALSDGAFWIIDQGVLARPHAALDLEQQQLLATLAAESQPGDLVLEPSLLNAPHTVSPVAWRAGRRVFLSHDGAAHYLPPAERRRREELLARAFDARDPAAAAAAIRASGARFVFAPAERPLPIRGIPGLALLRANAGGAIFRVEDDGP